MTARNKGRGVSKDEWLATALELLSDRGVAAVTVEALAKSLGIAKSGFYWHFRNRQELLEALLDYWMREMTEVITADPEVMALGPAKRLERTAEMIIDRNLTRYELAIRQWALTDPVAARGVSKVNRVRLDVIRRTFAELGFEGDDLEMRTMLFVCYQSMEEAVFKGISRKRRREMISRRVALVTQRTSD